MSSSTRGRSDAPGIRNEPATTPKPSGSGDVPDPYSGWLDRMQRARARQAAITRNIYTWSNYKNWADRMRDSWQQPAGQGDDPAVPGTRPGAVRHPKK